MENLRPPTSASPPTQSKTHYLWPYPVSSCRPRRLGPGRLDRVFILVSEHLDPRSLQTPSASKWVWPHPVAVVPTLRHPWFHIHLCSVIAYVDILLSTACRARPHPPNATKAAKRHAPLTAQENHRQPPGPQLFPARALRNRSIIRKIGR